MESSAELAATSCIDVRSGLGRGSVQVLGVVALVRGCPGGLVACDSQLACAAPGTDPERERLKKGMLCQ